MADPRGVSENQWKWNSSPYLGLSLWFGDIISEKQCPICLRLHEKAFENQNFPRGRAPRPPQPNLKLISGLIFLQTCRMRLKRDDDGSEERDSDVDLVTLSLHVLRGTPILHVAYLQFTKLHQMRKEKKMSDYVYLKIYDKLRSSSQIHDSPEIKSVRKVIMDDQVIGYFMPSPGLL